MLENIALGGVFDRFHKGHEHIIKKAIDRGKKVHLILIKCGDEETHAGKKADLVQPFELRHDVIKEFLKKVDPEGKVLLELAPEGVGIAPFLKWNIFWRIEDLTWFQVEEDKIIMKVVNLINEQRKKEFGLPPIKVEWIRSLKDKTGKKISASDIREKEVSK